MYIKNKSYEEDTNFRYQYIPYVLDAAETLLQLRDTENIETILSETEAWQELEDEVKLRRDELTEFQRSFEVDTGYVFKALYLILTVTIRAAEVLIGTTLTMSVPRIKHFVSCS